MKIPWRRKWQPTPGFLPGASHGQRSLADYRLWCCKESGMTEQLTHTHTHTHTCIHTHTHTHTRLFSGINIQNYYFSMGTLLTQEKVGSRSHVSWLLVQRFFHTSTCFKKSLLLLFSHCYIWLFATQELYCSRPPCLFLSPGVCPVHVHWVSDAIQPSHPLLPSSPPALNLSQHQDLFQWAGSSHPVAKV